MYERILVAIDGGETTRSTLETACALADRYQSKLGILYVTEPEEITDELIHGAEVEGVLRTPNYVGAIDRYTFLGASHVREDMQRAEAVSNLSAEIAERVVSEAEAFSKGEEVKAVKTFVRSGDVADAILEVAAEADADLIVTGHKRRSILGDLIHSSVAEAVDRKAKCPCLILSQ